MIKTFCDRCGKEITQYIDRATLTYKLHNGSLLTYSDDLCEECYLEFVKWMENKD